MKIKIEWENVNGPGVKVNLYRHTATFTTPTPEQLIATIEDDSDFYIDDIPEGSTRFYLVEFERGGLKSVGKPMKVVATFSKGPGPQELIFGDTEYGYFGTVNNFMSYRELHEKVTETLREMGTLVTEKFQVHKILFKGRVFLALNMSVAAGTVVRGVPQANTFIQAASDLNKEIEHGGYRYRVRTVSAGSEDEIRAFCFSLYSPNPSATRSPEKSPNGQRISAVTLSSNGITLSRQNPSYLLYLNGNLNPGETAADSNRTNSISMILFELKD